MNARDELLRAIRGTRHMYALHLQVPADIVEHVANGVADAILAAGYRKPKQVTTAEELDALELRSIVRDSDGEPFELTDNGWRYWLYEESFRSLEISLPATVLHEPEATA